MITISLLPLVVLTVALIGFLRSGIDSSKPEGLLAIKEISDKWMNDNNWLSRFSLIFLPFLFLYNLLLWFVFGLKSILDFFLFLFTKIWWLIMFFWNEILTPSIFWLIKLVWHYPIGFLWKFFEFSFSNIGIVLKKDSLTFSFIRLLKLISVTAMIYLGYLFYPNIISLVLGSILFFLYFQFTIFKYIGHYRPEYTADKVIPSIKLISIWLAIAVVSSSILIFILDLNIFFVSALGSSLNQVLLPIALLIVVALLASITCLAPYYATRDGVNTLEFLKAILFRIPKLIYAQPFQLIGAAIVSIIPFIVVFILNYGVKLVTQNDFIEWHAKVESVGEHIPNYSQASNNIEADLKGIDSLRLLKDSTEVIYKKDLNKLNSLLSDAKQLKEEILDNQIHTFKGEAYVGETQIFSIPSIANCAQYKWLIEKEGNKIAEFNSYSGNDESSSKILRYQWSLPGEYIVKLTPSNTCGDGSTYQRTVFVVGKPFKKAIQRPIGKTIVCENEEVSYKTAKGYKNYEWRHPFGETSTTNESLTLNWGNKSGTIQVRAQEEDGSYTLWRGTDVNVFLAPGSDKPIKSELLDEFEEPFKPNRPFMFVTREMANDSIVKIKAKIKSLGESNDIKQKNLDSEISGLKAEIIGLKEYKSEQIHYMIGELIAVVGLILIISILLISLFSYFVLFHYDLFNFHQDGTHYWRETLNDMQRKNPKQPLFAFFLLICLLLIIKLILQYI